MKLFRRLWRDENGIVVTSDFVLLCTILLCGTIVGIFVVRTATLKLFVNVAVGISRQQTHEFDTDDTFVTGNEDPETVDTDDDGVYGYESMKTEDFPLTDEEGEEPEKIDIAPAEHERQGKNEGSSG